MVHGLIITFPHDQNPWDQWTRTFGLWILPPAGQYFPAEENMYNCPALICQWRTIIFLPWKFVGPETWSQPGNLPGPRTQSEPPAMLNSLEDQDSVRTLRYLLSTSTCVVEEETSLQWLDPVIRAHSGWDCRGCRWIPCCSSWVSWCTWICWGDVWRSNADMIDYEETAMKTVINK